MSKRVMLLLVLCFYLFPISYVSSVENNFLQKKPEHRVENNTYINTTHQCQVSVFNKNWKVSTQFEELGDARFQFKGVPGRWTEAEWLATFLTIQGIKNSVEKGSSTPADQGSNVPHQNGTDIDIGPAINNGSGNGLPPVPNTEVPPPGLFD